VVTGYETFCTAVKFLQLKTVGPVLLLKERPIIVKIKYRIGRAGTIRNTDCVEYWAGVRIPTAAIGGPIYAIG